MQTHFLFVGALLLLAFLLVPAGTLANTYGGGGYGVGSYNQGETYANPPGQFAPQDETGEEEAPEPPVDPASTPLDPTSSDQQDVDTTPATDSENNQEGKNREASEEESTSGPSEVSGNSTTSENPRQRGETWHAPLGVKIALAVGAVGTIGLLGLLLRSRQRNLL